MDYMKIATIVKFTAEDLGEKQVRIRDRHEQKKQVRRAGRRKLKQDLRVQY